MSNIEVDNCRWKGKIFIKFSLWWNNKKEVTFISFWMLINIHSHKLWNSSEKLTKVNDNLPKKHLEKNDFVSVLDVVIIWKRGSLPEQLFTERDCHVLFIGNCPSCVITVFVNGKNRDEEIMSLIKVMECGSLIYVMQNIQNEIYPLISNRFKRKLRKMGKFDYI